MEDATTGKRTVERKGRNVDGEGLALRADGSFYVSDEYGATVYHVSKTGQMLGMITPPQALLPQFAGGSGYSGFTTAAGAIATVNASDQ